MYGRSQYGRRKPYYPPRPMDMFDEMGLPIYRNNINKRPVVKQQTRPSRYSGYNNVGVPLKQKRLPPMKEVKLPIDKLIVSSKFYMSVCRKFYELTGEYISGGEAAAVKKYLESIDASKFNKKFHELPDRKVISLITEDWLKKRKTSGILNQFSGKTKHSPHRSAAARIGINSETDTILNSDTYIATSAKDAKAPEIKPTIAATVSVGNLFGLSEPRAIMSYFNPQALYSNTQILLDTKNRNNSRSVDTFTWTLTNLISTSPGVTYVAAKVRDIKAIRFPKLQLPHSASLYNQHRRVGLYINEISGQSVLTKENARYHVLFKTTKQNDFVELDPTGMNGRHDYIYFDQPVTELSNVTLSFTSPASKVVFDLDQSTYTVTTYGNPTEFTTAEAHNLSTGDQVEISDFSTDDASADSAVITQMNAIHTNILVTSTTTFTVAVDSSTVTPTAGLMGKIYYESKRIFIPMHIMFIKPGNSKS